MLSYMLAMDRQRGIGVRNQLPWHLPEDLKYFKRVTMGKDIIMGRKTYESIGKPLPGRKNIILTQNKGYRAEGCTVVHSPREALAVSSTEEVFVIGGAEIFRLLWPRADRLYITRIEETFEADIFFPDISPSEWVKISSEQGIKDERNPYTYYFEVYERKDG